jgi:flagellar motor switch protein FliN/FliY
MDETENLELSDLESEAMPDGEDAMAQAMAEEAAEKEASQQIVMPHGDDDEITAAGLNAVYDIPVQIAAVLGTSSMQVSQLLKLGRGAVVELDRKVGEAIDIYVNNRLVARGEVVVVNERLGVTMTEIIKAD